MPICVSYKRLDELEDKLMKELDDDLDMRTDLLAVIAELRRCRKFCQR